ncbi:hypothetical protein cyc_00530 [Cyclospora cayetanensis]|uniref:Uncharacterized protein n=1 Tax=Cyclospora cayetanensis TaxID=88456 RepID=A0A1D3CVZ3_9EIME|nr:hypothetical protein cyc_00530 [Cyclospora cayetanensis]
MSASHVEGGCNPASRQSSQITLIVTRPYRWCGILFEGEYLVGPLPCDFIARLFWLSRHQIWYFRSDTLRGVISRHRCDCQRCWERGSLEARDLTSRTYSATAAYQAYDALAQRATLMSMAEAVALPQPPSERYNSLLGPERASLSQASLEERIEHCKALVGIAVLDSLLTIPVPVIDTTDPLPKGL